MTGWWWFNLDHEPIDQREAEALLRDTDARRVAYDVVTTDTEEVVVSTVFLVLDHAMHPSSPPVLYETLVMGGIEDHQVTRYTTRPQAIAGHDQVVASMRELMGATHRRGGRNQ